LVQTFGQGRERKRVATADSTNSQLTANHNILSLHQSENIVDISVIFFRDVIFCFFRITVPLKRDSATRFFASGFFHESPFPKSLKIQNTIRVISNFSIIRGDIRQSRCTTGMTTRVANLPPVSTTPGAKMSKQNS
jgi:hypothetical protein